MSLATVFTINSNQTSRATGIDYKTLLHPTCVSLCMFKNWNGVIAQEAANKEFPILVNRTICDEFCKKAQDVTFQAISKKQKKR